jgi:hypothetical protein
VHGYEIRFDLKAGIGQPPRQDPIVGTIQQWTGSNFGNSSYDIATLQIDLSNIKNTSIKQAHPELAQNNEVTFAADPVAGAFTHPIAFVENGSHEFWPSEKGSVDFSPNHNGRDPDHKYLTRDIPNLGEIEMPFGPRATILLQYDGYWGFVNVYNDPPPGPSMHKSWNWFVNTFQPIACTAAE